MRRARNNPRAGGRRQNFQIRYLVLACGVWIGVLSAAPALSHKLGWQPDAFQTIQRCERQAEFRVGVSDVAAGGEIQATGQLQGRLSGIWTTSNLLNEGAMTHLGSLTGTGRIHLGGVVT
jgi:hypothetical protein